MKESKIETLSLSEYFDTINYEVTDLDLKRLDYIVGLTKTRPQIVSYSGPCAGDEHVLLIKAVAESIGAKTIFEIGTGRATSCFAASFVDTVEVIDTVDIRPHEVVMLAAVHNIKVYVSNKMLFEHFKFDEKNKINFFHTSQLLSVYQRFLASGVGYDLAHIDGNHSDYEIVMQDFLNCYSMLRPGGKIIFDDYEPNRFIVKKVVTDIINTMPNLKPQLILHRGHLFDKETDGSDASPIEMTAQNGVVVMTKPMAKGERK